MTPEEAVARASIRVTQNAYHARAERNRASEVADLFTPDGVLEFTAQTHRGRDAIAAAFTAVAPSGPAVPSGRAVPSAAAEAVQTPFFLRHHLTTSHVEFVNDNEAKGWSYFLVISPIGLDHAGRYIDTYVRTGDDWLFATRRVSLDWQAENSVVRR
jgi:hypothetical protein